MAGEKPKLSRLDRLFLSNQMRILEALYPEEADGIATRREAIERGYEMLYQWDMDDIYDGDDIMTAEESTEVWDTLDMFDSINRFLEASNNEELKNNSFAKFRGYDGNNETKFMTFTAYTIERLKRFEYVPTPRKGYWNSHMPVRETYQRMLEEWRKVPRERRFELTEAEVKSILAAAIHPENR
ncbi:MAG: YfbU family protein [Mesorhizobium sp.]|uniref:YfbU family protein n=1 Tax=Mesorhizobium sp. TaxID=1871066 RepID=UPI000FE6DC12|nr:YfbU family protein [Mesorhizobium sp.]RWP02387.1 MAG: YfbU family protein [Mesorhizobium sp.]TIM39066.1 MAG: YfbU family protein [Mesorhizobium sp.]